MAGNELSRSRRGLWVGLGVFFGVSLLVLLVLCAAAFLVFRERLQPGIPGERFTSWAEAAARARQTIIVYEPTYLPEDAGEPELWYDESPEGFGHLTAIYISGLTITEYSGEYGVQGEYHERTDVRDSLDAYFTELEGQGRVLVVNKYGTWVELSGAPDEEMERVASEMRESERGDE